MKLNRSSESELRVLSYGRFAKELKDYLALHHPSIQVIIPNSVLDLTKQVHEVNVYAGFYELEGLDVSHLDWIHSFGAGLDRFMSNESIRENEIPISRSIGHMGRAIGEYCLAHILAIYQHVSVFRHQQQKAIWNPITPVGLEDKKVLILGTGAIGQGISQVLSPMNMTIYGVNSDGRAMPNFHQCFTWGQLSIIGPECDILINAFPLTDQTDGLINSQFLANFNEVLFINIGRGAVVDSEESILQSLSKGNLSHAVLDVFKEEPLTELSKLWKHDRVILTPHISGLTSFEDVTKGFEKGLQAYLIGNMSAFLDYQKGY